MTVLSSNSNCYSRYNQLEIYSFEDGQLNLVISRPVYGRITILDKFRPADSTTDHLFLGTDRSYFFTLSWNAEKKRFQNVSDSPMDLADKTARESQTGERSHIDPRKEFLTLEVYEGIVTTIPLIRRGKRKNDFEIGVMGDPVWSRIPEFFVKSSAFIQRPRDSVRENAKLALLWEDHEGNQKIKLRQLVFSQGTSNQEASVEYADLDPMEKQYDGEPLDFGASHLIPIQEEPYGLLVLGELSVSYYDDQQYRVTFSKALEDATIWVAWERIDNERYLLADDYGKLYLLMLETDISDQISGWRIDPLGQTSRASCLVYLDAGLLFVGSHQGDSQVVQIKPKDLEIVQSFPNIAPILDFSVMDMGNRSGDGPGNEFSTGQARIVAGSGAWVDGSLRSVRSGVGVEEQAIIPDLEHVTDLFGLKTDASSEHVDALLVSFVDESRVFLFGEEEEVEEVDSHKGIILSEQTLYAANLSRGQLLQVTSSGIQLIELDGGMVSAQWAPDSSRPLTAVSATDAVLAVCVDGQRVVLFDLLKDLEIQKELEIPAGDQVACLSLSHLFPETLFVGYWKKSNIQLLDIKTMAATQSLAIGEEDGAVPRSILVNQIFSGGHPTLFVSLADGHVVSYDINPTTYALTGRKSTLLGTRQADLKPIPREDGTFSVFASSEHPSLIYAEEGRMAFSAVTADKINSVCPFHSASFPGAVAIASPIDVRIGLIDSKRTTHVQTLALGETARRLAYSPKLKSFAIGTIKRTIKDGAEIAESSLKLADEVLFKELDTYRLHQDELIEAVIRAELDDGYGQKAERFIVGTSFLDDNSAQTLRGRILVFEVTDDRLLKLITQNSTKGACRCLAMMGDRIVAALVKTLVVYSLDFTTGARPFLNKCATYRTSTAPIDIEVTENRIAVADLMKSVSVVEFKENDRAEGLKDSLTEICRHYQTFWSTAVARVAPETWLESDAEGNLVVIARDTVGVTEEDRRRMKAQSEFSLGELVNRIRSVDVATNPSAVAIPKAFLATVSSALLAAVIRLLNMLSLH
jgi:DNA damage-binding protein 1